MGYWRGRHEGNGWFSFDWVDGNEGALAGIGVVAVSVLLLSALLKLLFTVALLITVFLGLPIITIWLSFYIKDHNGRALAMGAGAFVVCATTTAWEYFFRRSPELAATSAVHPKLYSIFLAALWIICLILCLWAIFGTVIQRQKAKSASLNYTGSEFAILLSIATLLLGVCAFFWTSTVTVRSTYYEDEQTRKAYIAEAEACLSRNDEHGAGYAFLRAEDFESAQKYIDFSSLIAAGKNVTLALTQDGRVLADGDSYADYWNMSSGQTKVEDWSSIVRVGAHWMSAVTYGIHADGSVSVAGDNDYIALANSKEVQRLAIGYGFAAGVKTDGTANAVGTNDKGQCDVGSWSNLTDIRTGYEHTVGLCADGTVLAIGDNTYGQCDVQGWSKIKSIDASVYGTIGLRSDGRVMYTSIYNSLANEVDNWTDIKQVAAGYGYIAAIRADGTVIVAGSKTEILGELMGDDLDVSSWHDIIAIDSGYLHLVGLTKQGTVVVTGGFSYEDDEISDWHLW